MAMQYDGSKSQASVVIQTSIRGASSQLAPQMLSFRCNVKYRCFYKMWMTKPHKKRGESRQTCKSYMPVLSIQKSVMQYCRSRAQKLLASSRNIHGGNPS